MRTFLMLYSTDFDGGDDDIDPYKSGKSSSSESRAFTLLASVCSNWRLCLTGWPQSPTRDWVRHQLKKSIERECTIHAHRHTSLLACIQARPFSLILTTQAWKQSGGDPGGQTRHYTATRLLYNFMWCHQSQ